MNNMKEVNEMNNKEIIENVSGRFYLTRSQALYDEFRKKGYGVRETARACGVSAATVSRTLKTLDRNYKKWSESNE